MKYATLGILYLCLASCQKEPKMPAASFSRTILYYLAADNDLTVEADEKIEVLRQGFPGGNHHLLIYCDRAGDTPQLLEIYRESNGQNTLRVIHTYPEQNSADGGTMRAIITEVKQGYPSDSYGLILFSHASGWLPAHALDHQESLMRAGAPLRQVRTYTMASDGSSELNLAGLKAALPDHGFDFIVFETCFAAGIELAYELTDKTSFIVGSAAEMLSPGFVPVYPAHLPELFEQQPGLSVFAAAYFNYWNAQDGDYRSATISVINTAALPALAAWIKNQATLPFPAQQLNSLQQFDRYADHRLFFDFEDYYGRLSGAGNTEALERLLAQAVEYQAATSAFIPGEQGFDIRRHCGISTYVPQDGFAALNEKFRQLSWYKDTHVLP